MDAKITRKRLANFLSYDWILLVACIGVAIILFEFLFTLIAVAPTTGQYFLYYYDYSIDTDSYSQFASLLEEDNTFSYDVLKVDYSVLSSTADTISIKLRAVQEGDIIITDCTPKESEEDDEPRSEQLIFDDRVDVGSLDKLLADAKDYLSRFYTDEVLNENAVRENFLTRMKKDNRYKTTEQKEQGILDEIERIKTLKQNVSDFEYFLNNADESCFYYYQPEGESESIRYGVKVLGLEIDSGNGYTAKHNPSEYFRLLGSSTAENVVIMFFDFTEYQPDLQFEIISFYDTIIRECSNILPQ